MSKSKKGLIGALVVLEFAVVSLSRQRESLGRMREVLAEYSLLEEIEFLVGCVDIIIIISDPHDLTRIGRQAMNKRESDLIATI